MSLNWQRHVLVSNLISASILENLPYCHMAVFTFCVEKNSFVLSLLWTFSRSICLLQIVSYLSWAKFQTFA